MRFLTLYLVAVASMCVHEYAHALAADLYGDRTPRRAGRLTLNPYVHLRLLGLGFHPMPLNRLWLGEDHFARVIMAGPAANLVLAGWGLLAGSPLIENVNLALFAFNCLPVKPLDGYHLMRYLFHSET